MANELWTSILEVILSQYRKYQLEPGISNACQWKVLWSRQCVVMERIEGMGSDQLSLEASLSTNSPWGLLAMCLISISVSETLHWKKIIKFIFSRVVRIKQGILNISTWQTKAHNTSIYLPSLLNKRFSNFGVLERHLGDTGLASPPRICSNSLQTGPRNLHI